MNNHIAHRVEFDAQGRLLSEQRLSIARAHLHEDFRLDLDLVEQLNRDYFATVDQLTLGLYQPIVEAQRLRIRMPLIGNILIFGDKQVDVNMERAEIVWPISGGAMLARDVESGGRLIIGAEWDTRASKGLVLYTRVEGYTSRIIGIFGRRIGICVYRLTQGLSHKFITHRFLRKEAARLITRR